MPIVEGNISEDAATTEGTTEFTVDDADVGDIQLPDFSETDEGASDDGYTVVTDEPAKAVEAEETSPPQKVMGPKGEERFAKLKAESNAEIAARDAKLAALEAKVAELEGTTAGAAAQVEATRSEAMLSNLTLREESLGAALNVAKAAFKAARESGDTDAEVEAQINLSNLVTDLKQVKYAKQHLEGMKAEKPPEGAKPAAPVAKGPSPATQEWMSKNSWYRQDKAKTYLAQGVHQELVREGYLSGNKPDEKSYFAELDRRLSELSPASPPQKKLSAVGGGGKPGTVTKGKVTLTKAEYQTAKEFEQNFGIPIKEYAKELVKLRASKTY